MEQDKANVVIELAESHFEKTGKQLSLLQLCPGPCLHYLLSGNKLIEWAEKMIPGIEYRVIQRLKKDGGMGIVPSNHRATGSFRGNDVKEILNNSQVFRDALPGTAEISEQRTSSSGEEHSRMF